MKQIMRYVGMDVHAETIAVAVVEKATRASTSSARTDSDLENITLSVRPELVEGRRRFFNGLLIWNDTSILADSISDSSSGSLAMRQERVTISRRAFRRLISLIFEGLEHTRGALTYTITVRRGATSD